VLRGLKFFSHSQKTELQLKKVLYDFIFT
jgi:hypothetical protein